MKIKKTAYKVSLITIIVNLMLAIFKLFAGLVAKSGAMVSDAVTKTEGVLEAHERYIDIQFLDGACEKIEYVNRRDLTVKVPYVEDIVFYEDAPSHSNLILGRHDFAVFYPEDAHKPGMAVEQPITIRKVVVKVKV